MWIMALVQRQWQVLVAAINTALYLYRTFRSRSDTNLVGIFFMLGSQLRSVVSYFLATGELKRKLFKRYYLTPKPGIANLSSAFLRIQVAMVTSRR